MRSAFFAAAPSEVTAEVLRRGPAGRCPAVFATRMPDLALALLVAALDARGHSEVAGQADSGGFAVEGGPDGPWVARLPDALRDALAAASAEELRRFTASLVRAAEPTRADELTRAALRADLAALAREARAEGKALYLWTTL
ncbi:MAG TPA: hypothetical protein VG370_20705 [Chloroflexota bacterium]|jgi:hypothetical protein|nr:hypothetical protein [Chloroflexota bacterium]